jgi:hypothetical protein
VFIDAMRWLQRRSADHPFRYRGVPFAPRRHDPRFRSGGVRLAFKLRRVDAVGRVAPAPVCFDDAGCTPDAGGRDDVGIAPAPSRPASTASWSTSTA